MNKNINYKIRQVNSNEVRVALDLALRVFMQYEADSYDAEALKKFKADCIENEKYINNYVTGKHLMLCAYDNKKIIGIINESGNGHISMAFVEGEYHRKGIATALMKKIIVSIKLQGYDRITLNSSPYGLAFYMHFGFTATDVEQKKDGFIFTPMEYTPKELWDVYDKYRVKTGKIVERGRTMGQDEYHIVVHVWIKNSFGEWLISKRTPNKHYPNMWEPTGGSVIMGEDSLTAALREAREELGVNLNQESGFMWNSYLNQHNNFPQFSDVWVFSYDCSIESIVLQEGETCDAMWASNDKILQMVNSGEFIIFPYIDKLLEN